MLVKLQTLNQIKKINCAKVHEFKTISLVWQT